MTEPLTPEQLQKRVVGILQDTVEHGLPGPHNNDLEVMVGLLMAKAYATGWHDAGGDFDLLTMLEAGLA
jgi:hypothetical protein